jgi:hypothetical protein
MISVFEPKPRSLLHSRFVTCGSYTSPPGRSCTYIYVGSYTSPSRLSRSPPTDLTGKKAPPHTQGQPEKVCSSRWAMYLPRGMAIRDCESRSKTPTRSESLRDLLLLGPAPMQAGMFPSKGIRWVQLRTTKRFLYRLPPTGILQTAFAPPPPAALPLPPCLVPALRCS